MWVVCFWWWWCVSSSSSSVFLFLFIFSTRFFLPFFWRRHWEIERTDDQLALLLLVDAEEAVFIWLVVTTCRWMGVYHNIIGHLPSIYDLLDYVFNTGPERKIWCFPHGRGIVCFFFFWKQPTGGKSCLGGRLCCSYYYYYLLRI